ncbi:MAG: hypothetical protein EON54_15655 [Alcaligenaceae bacterium]|nr:MAG: hypothetical protein EON54_15655 [Alcaligenaceae bacterium]
MSIVVYWLQEPEVPAMRVFASNELMAALQFCEDRRREGKRHVSISSELPESVGKPGVNAVQAKVLPDGSAYEWTKAHRGAGPERSSGGS